MQRELGVQVGRCQCPGGSWAFVEHCCYKIAKVVTVTE